MRAESSDEIVEGGVDRRRIRFLPAEPRKEEYEALRSQIAILRPGRGRHRFRLRALVASHQQLAAKLGELEKKIASHDKSIVNLFDAVRSLMTAPEKPQRQIGFQTEGKGTPRGV